MAKRQRLIPTLIKTITVHKEEYVQTVHQEEEYEYFKPILAGDVLSVVHTVSNVYDKQVPNGQLVFIVIESRGNDKRGKTVFKSRRVLVELRK